MTGIRAASVREGSTLRVAGRELVETRTFSSVAHGELFWHENANGLAEIAVNMGSAAALLQLKVGSTVALQQGR